MRFCQGRQRSQQNLLKVSPHASGQPSPGRFIWIEVNDCDRPFTVQGLGLLRGNQDDLLIESARLEAMHHMAELRFNELQEKNVVSLAEQLSQIEMDMDMARAELKQKQRMLHAYRTDLDRIMTPSVEVVE